MKLNDMTHEELVKRLVTRKDMPRHYAEAWLNKGDELGLDHDESIRALAFANSIVGMDLDSWIWGDDFDEYVEMTHEHENNYKERMREIKFAAYMQVAEWMKQKAWDMRSREVLDVANMIIDGEHIRDGYGDE